MRRIAGAGAALSLLVTLLAVGPAGGAQGDPVRINVAAPKVVAANANLRISIKVAASRGAFDIAARPVRLRVRMAGECGGSYAGTVGPRVYDRKLSPQPTKQGAYSKSLRPSVRLHHVGVQTVCAFVEDSQHRQFATSTDVTVRVKRS